MKNLNINTTQTNLKKEYEEKLRKHYDNKTKEKRKIGKIKLKGQNGKLEFKLMVKWNVRGDAIY